MDDTTPQQPESANQNDSVSPTNNNSALIDSFCEITSATKQEALFFLESHQWDLDSALSTFLDDPLHHSTAAAADETLPPVSASPSPSESGSPNYSPSQSPSRSRSRSSSPVPARYRLRSRGGSSKKAKKAEASGSGPRGGIRTLADLNQKAEGGGDSGSDRDDDDDDDDYQPQEYYAGGERSGMLVEEPNRRYDADAVFDHAKQSGGNVGRPARRSSSRSFTGTGRLLSGETVQSASQPPAAVNHTITLWRNGFTVNDGPLRRFDDPANASFLESITRSECPKELQPADRSTKVHLEMLRREENYTEPKKRQSAFQGKGKTLGGSSDLTTTEDSKPTDPAPPLVAPVTPLAGLVVDSLLPSTSIQLRLADGTRMVSRFNLSHTIRDVRSFIDASRPGMERNYQLQAMGFPPKQLTDLDQTIEEAGIASSVVIQRY